MTSILAQTKTATGATAEAGKSLWRTMQSTLRQARLGFGKAARAHDRRRASEAVGVDTMGDTGMAPETASGIQAWQADLPFFMQSGFGKR